MNKCSKSTYPVRMQHTVWTFKHRTESWSYIDLILYLRWLCQWHSTQPGQPPQIQSLSSHTDSEKVATQPVLLPLTTTLRLSGLLNMYKSNHSTTWAAAFIQTGRFPHSQGSCHELLLASQQDSTWDRSRARGRPHQTERYWMVTNVTREMHTNIENGC